MHTSIDRLRGIKTLSQLAAYLRDELDWPIESDNTEDITFDYEASELGLDEKTAVRIKEIKQLRPLTGSQPWGIFFINFEKKRLPVVVMRRILRALVLKKRTSSKAAERQAWQPSDLLFISAYGEESDRAITFAHFVEDEELGGLAELRVLGWDDDDTPLKYDYVAHTLQEKLRWQDSYQRKPDEWRKTWREAFVLRHREVIKTSQQLALALADLAKKIRGRVRSLLRYEDGFGEIRKLQRAFQTALIHDLTDEGFADMFAQTVTYGLFSLACRRTIPGEGTAFVKEDLSHYFTSPFLSEMLGVFLGLKSRKGQIDFDELGIADVTGFLQNPDTHMEAVLRDFGNRTRGEDPVIHFYEHFLSAYNKQLKIQRGVFYTPQPVVSYIVRSVHELLQTEFGLEDGLASTVTWGEMTQKFGGTSSTSPTPDETDGDSRSSSLPRLKLPPLTDEPGEKRTISPDEPFVQILDPATGTATFLVEVIDVIHRHLAERWKKSGLAAMPALPVVAATAAPSEQAGGLTEISRGSSEPGERTPPDADKKRTHPGGVPESHARATVPAPLRGASGAGAASGGSRFAPPPANFQQPSGLPATPRTFAEYWNLYVPRALLPRLHAFELMMAPYAIAHMKIGLKLAETGYRFGTEERARIYLTNALEPWVKQLPLIGFDALAHEAAAVNEIKRHKRFTVVIGNPPYSLWSQNLAENLRAIINPYRFVNGEPIKERGALQFEKILQDDYVKFFRLSQVQIDQAGCGILGLITNHAFADNPTLRGMRDSLLRSFPTIFCVNLHGNSSKKEKCPDGSADENVFDIQQGVAIFHGLNAPGEDTETRSCADLWGNRESKYATLAKSNFSSLGYRGFSPTAPFLLFKTQDSGFAAEYERAWKIADMFQQGSMGVVTARDHISIAFEDEPLLRTATEFRDSSLSDKAVCEKLDIPEKKGWDVAKARALIRQERNLKPFATDIGYRPFDTRRIFYHRSLVWGMSWPTMQHVLAKENIGISTTRSIEAGNFQHVFASARLIGHHFVSLKEVNYFFPLWVFPQEDGLAFRRDRTPNLKPEFLKATAQALGLRQSGADSLPAGLTPEDIFHYAYAVFHSPGYRSRYAEFLKIDFPRLPLTGNLELFRALARLGGELTALHLLESPKLAHATTQFVSGSAGFQPAASGIPAGRIVRNREAHSKSAAAPAGDEVPGRDAGNSGQDARAPHPLVEKISWSHNTVWVDKAQTTGFQGVREDVWNFHIGGYQVCEKWLKDRKGRTLTKEDLDHYQKIVVALSETIRLMKEIDEVIEKAGGWPDAFTAAASA